MRLGQKMTTNEMFIVIFYSFYETKVEDNDKQTLSLFSAFFSCIVKKVCHHLLVFSSSAKDDDKP
jgi:hypothetical protein